MWAQTSGNPAGIQNKKMMGFLGIKMHQKMEKIQIVYKNLKKQMLPLLKSWNLLTSWYSTERSSAIILLKVLQVNMTCPHLPYSTFSPAGSFRPGMLGGKSPIWGQLAW